MRRLRAAYAEATGPLRRTLAGREGVAMLIALFVVTVMTMTVVDFAFSVQVDANVAANGSDDLRAFYLARSAQRAGALLLQVGDPTADRDHRFDPWANPTELVLLQLENRGLIHIPQGRVYLGPVDENCSPAVLSAELASTTGSGLQDIIVDENRKLSVGNLVKNRGQANEAVDFMTLLMLRNLFANYVDAQIETLSEVYGRIEPDDMADTMASALVDWIDSDAYARPYRLEGLAFGVTVGESVGALPPDTTADRIASQLDAFEANYYASADRSEPTALFAQVCGTDPTPPPPNGPILDVKDLCHVAGFYDLFSADPGFLDFLRRTVTPYATAGLNILLAPPEVVAALPADPVAAAQGAGNVSLGYLPEYEDFLAGVAFAQGNINLLADFQNGAVGFLQAAVLCVDESNCEGPAPTDYGTDPQYFGAYKALGITSDIFTVVGTGCMDYAFAQVDDRGEVENEFLKRDPVIKQVRVTYKRSGGSPHPGAAPALNAPPAQSQLTPIAWKVD